MANNKGLSDYLATGKVPENTVDAQDAALIIKVTRKGDPFFEILANICAVCMLAKDLHYRAYGKPFYGNHLLADLICDIEKDADDINEIRYMGELQTDAPFKAEVARAACAIIDAIPGAAIETYLVEGIYDRCNALVGLVEDAKKTNPASGTTAVLDAISQKALQYAGFMNRVMKGEGNALVDADAIATASAAPDQVVL